MTDKRTPEETKLLNNALGLSSTVRLTLFDGDLFCQGELPIADHLSQIRDLVLFHKGVLAELLEHIGGGEAPSASLAIAIGGERLVIAALTASYNALAEWDEKYEEIRDIEREMEADDESQDSEKDEPFPDDNDEVP